MTINLYRIAVIALLITVAALAGVLLTQHTASAASSSTSVSSFNDGYATGEQDACQQGFAPACAWLRSN